MDFNRTVYKAILGWDRFEQAYWVDAYEDRCSGWVDEEWHETVSIDSQNLVHMHHRLREIYKAGMPKDTN